jgi:transposase
MGAWAAGIVASPITLIIPMPTRPKRKTKAPPLPPQLQKVNLNAAAIDVGATEHYVAVPPGRATETVRCFGGHTADLHALAHWLKDCGITTVAMESTSNYWVPLFQILECAGLEVVLCNSRHVKNLPGRKTDVLDCQWLQELHTYGLLSGSFRPADKVCVVRSYLRHRDNLTKAAASHVQHMQKALTEMNIGLHHVLSDLTGVSGLAIIRAILEGERDTLKLATLKHPYVRKSPQEIAQALEGDYREEHLFALRQALELYEAYQMRIAECDGKIQAALRQLESPHPAAPAAEVAAVKPRKTARAQADFELKSQLEQLCGVDLTALPGFQALSAQILISEIGLDMSRWKTEKHFCSWLRLSPGNRISGGKRMKTKPHKGHNRAAQILRVCAQAAIQSKSALGAFGRRLRARLDAPKAIKALAHKLARLVYRMLKSGKSYADAGELYYEHKYRDHLLKRLHKQAALFGFQLTPAPTE